MQDSSDATKSPTSPPVLMSQDSEDENHEDFLNDLSIRMLEDEENFTDEEPQYYKKAELPLQDPFDSVQEDSLIHRLQGLRYSGVGLFANDDRNLPWKEIYTNLRMRGKRSSESVYPWEAINSLRGKKTVANLPWQMGLQSPMLRGKKSGPSTLPWKMSMQFPMLRGKKTKTLVNLPWQMDLKSPMLRGKKSSTTPLPWEMTLESPIMKEEDLSNNHPEVGEIQEEFQRGKKAKNVIGQTKAYLPWGFDYLSPMIRG
eukprot:GFUD01003603.1.p1 GENE.GFUD01003603.1~~GFUD01003603.1.p1  ORF type:complete len:275 (+),score=72.77 GFUD01003603.1:55-825(+)